MYYLNGLGCGKSCPCDSCRKAEMAESLSGLSDDEISTTIPYTPPPYYSDPSSANPEWLKAALASKPAGPYMPSPLGPGFVVPSSIEFSEPAPYTTYAVSGSAPGAWPEKTGSLPSWLLPAPSRIPTVSDLSLPPPTVQEKTALDNVLKWSWNTPVSGPEWKGVPFLMPNASTQKKLSWLDKLTPAAFGSLAVSVPMSAAILKSLYSKRKKGKKKIQDLTQYRQQQGMSWTSIVLIGIGVVVVGGLVFGGYTKFKKK